MKKLFAILVVFVLVAGAAFAQVTALVETRLWVLNGADMDNMTTGGSIGAAYLQFNGANEAGTLGGTFRFRNTDQGSTSGGSGVRFHRVFTWWRPIPQVRVFLGIDNDGLFDTAGLAGWAFHAGDNDYMFNHHWDFWRQVFPGNWDGFGLAISVYPMQGLQLNLVVPTGNLGWYQGTNSQVTRNVPIEDMYPWGLRFMGSYLIPDIGTVHFVWNFQDKEALAGEHFADTEHYGRFGLNLHLTALNAMGIQAIVGGSVVLPKYSDTDPDIHAGFGVQYSAEGWAVKARMAVRLPGGDADAFISGNVMPVFDIPGGQAMIDIGLTTQGSDMGWFLTPIYRMPIPGGAFSIGLHIYSNINMGGNIGLSGNEDVSFRIPMFLRFQF